MSGNKDRGQKATKKPAKLSLKEKRTAKREKNDGQSTTTISGR